MSATGDSPSFRIRDTVRLLNQHGDIPAGTLGRVLGWFANTGNYVVDFAEPDAPAGTRVVEVEEDELGMAQLS